MSFLDDVLAAAASQPTAQPAAQPAASSQPAAQPATPTAEPEKKKLFGYSKQWDEEHPK